MTELLKAGYTGVAAHNFFQKPAWFVWFSANNFGLHVEIVNKSDSTVTKRLREKEPSRLNTRIAIYENKRRTKKN